MKITEEQRKLLTEWLGECWHEIGKYDLYCPKCDGQQGFDRRTFDNWEDFGAVVEKLGWGFIHTFEKEFLLGVSSKEYPERFCILVAEAIKEGVIK